MLFEIPEELFLGEVPLNDPKVVVPDINIQ
jgi:hypothetical protein